MCYAQKAKNKSSEKLWSINTLSVLELEIDCYKRKFPALTKEKIYEHYKDQQISFCIHIARVSTKVIVASTTFYREHKIY